MEYLRCLLESDAGLKLPLGLVCEAETQGHEVVPHARGVRCGLGGPRPGRAGDWHPDDCAGHGWRGHGEQSHRQAHGHEAEKSA